MILARYLVLLILLLSIQINQFSFALFSGHLQYIILCSSLISFFFFQYRKACDPQCLNSLIYICNREKQNVMCEFGGRKKKKNQISIILHASTPCVQKLAP